MRIEALSEALICFDMKDIFNIIPKETTTDLCDLLYLFLTYVCRSDVPDNSMRDLYVA